MVEISAAEAAKRFGQICEDAREGPIYVTQYNKPAVVIIRTEEYERLKARDRTVYLAEEIPGWLADQVATGTVDQKYCHLDHVAAPEGYE